MVFRGAAVVTGGCGPLGAQISIELARAGHRVVAVDLPGAAREARSGLENLDIEVYEADLSSRASLDSLCVNLSERTEGLACLVNNAAYTGTANLGGYSVPFEEQDDSAFDTAVLFNLGVPFRLARRLSPTLRRTKDASIINVSSIYGLVGPDLSLYTGTAMGNPAGYAASKGGLVQLTRYLSTVLAPDIRVNCIAPGGIERGQPRAFVDRYSARTPLRRMATESDVVGLVSLLAGPKASYITGQTIAVDGGWTAW